ncbi:hypothetical protein Tsp_11732 [Trichinella spiralis]|uniref:hypothetical protein n=1 Tax=Trichinella spiralis TaxID=6334 RepID=UPI0001EFE6EC|nr:hypothetical protein Tsp_11732 [Trichinella spiralis]
MENANSSAYTTIVVVVVVVVRMQKFGGKNCVCCVRFGVDSLAQFWCPPGPSNPTRQLAMILDPSWTTSRRRTIFQASDGDETPRRAVCQTLTATHQHLQYDETWERGHGLG